MSTMIKHVFSIKFLLGIIKNDSQFIICQLQVPIQVKYDPIMNLMFGPNLIVLEHHMKMATGKQ